LIKEEKKIIIKTMNNEENILNKTKRDYNLISNHFSETRKRPWDNFKFFFEGIPSRAKVLDLGCGNGRFNEFLEGKDYTGLDKSGELIKKAKEKYPKQNFLVGDALNLPFEDNSFDYVISIAVIHHMPTKKTRKKFLKEIKRVLKSEGEARISTWNYLESKKSLYFKNLFKKVIGKIAFRDVFIPWHNQNGEVITKRYYHFFTIKELRKLFKKTEWKTKIIKKGEGIRSNIFIFAENVNKKDQF
jgi:ubiquinone/menaquinone biosynthesis C-methylase UbiE